MFAFLLQNLYNITSVFRGKNILPGIKRELKVIHKTGDITVLFIKTDNLKAGMRLARPIYNKLGVMLYERNSKLTIQGIASIKNFGLIGIYVLEPAEPVPPMTKDDLDFERFQTIASFAIKEELFKMTTTKKAPKVKDLAEKIIGMYGRFDKKITFIQNLRSMEDYTYLHSLNVSILTALITHKMNLKLEEQLETVISAIVHDVGKLMAPTKIQEKTILTKQEKDIMKVAEIAGFDLIGEVFSSMPGIRRICVQAEKILRDFEKGKASDVKMVTGTKILLVAETFDTMTAMQLEKDPESEVAALKYLLQNPEIYDPRVVDALIHCINILQAGTSVELNTGEKGLVIAYNNNNVLRPMVLCFKDNQILDLSNETAYGDIEIKDIMKTMDNRYIMDTATLKKVGIIVEEPEYVEVQEEEEEFVPGRDF